MRYAIAVILLAGCTDTSIAPPPAGTYTPTIATSLGVAISNWDAPPLPEPNPVDDDCTNCDGRGWLGDGQPRSDCPECNTKWDNHVFGLQDVDIKNDPPACNCDCESKLAEISDRLESLADAQTCPPPIDVNELADAIAERLRTPASGALLPKDSGDSDPPASGIHTNPEAGVIDSSDGGGELAAHSDEPPPSLDIEWISIDEARASGKPIWIHFTGDNCRHCVTFENNVLSDWRLKQASQAWACVLASDDAALLDAYGVREIPNDVFIVDRVVDGPMGASTKWKLSEFVKFLTERGGGQ